MKLAARLLGLGLVASLSWGASTAGATTASIGGRPANPDLKNPRTQSIFIFTLGSGESKSDQLFISNNTNKQETLEVYAVDSSTASDGSFVCEQKDSPKRTVGDWLKLPVSEVTLPARSNKTIDFSLVLPKGTQAGEYNGCISLEVKPAYKEAQETVTIRTRQAVRVAVVVPGQPGDIYKKVDIEKFAAGIERGYQAYETILKNTGNVSADVNVELRLIDMFGREVYKDTAQKVVLAGQPLYLKYDSRYKPFFGGFYTAKIAVSYDRREGVFGANDTSQLVWENSKGVTVFLWPSVWFFVAAAAFVLAVLLYVFRRKLNNRGKVGFKSL